MSIVMSSSSPFSIAQMEEEVSKLTAFNATSETKFMDIKRLISTAGPFHEDWKAAFRDDPTTFGSKDDLLYDQIQLNENNPGAITFAKAQTVSREELEQTAAKFFLVKGEDPEDAANKVQDIIRNTRAIFNGDEEDITIDIGLIDRLFEPSRFEVDKIMPKVIGEYYSDRFDSRRWEEGIVNTVLLRLSDRDVRDNEDSRAEKVLLDTFKMLFTNNAQYAESPVGSGTDKNRPIRIEQKFMGTHNLKDLMDDFTDANRNPFDIREAQSIFIDEDIDIFSLNIPLRVTKGIQGATSLLLPLLDGVPGTSLLPLVTDSFEGAIRDASQGKFPFTIDDILLPDSLRGIEELELAPDMEESFIRGIFGTSERFKKASLILNNAVWLDDGDNMILTLTGAVEYNPASYGLQGEKILIPDLDIRLINKNTGGFISMSKGDFVEYTAAVNAAIEEANRERIESIIEFLSPLQKMFKITPLIDFPISP